MARKNDMAFTVNNKVLVISEHQSTLNANMPLRDAIYYGRTMEKLIEPRALYRTGQIPIPTPEFFVFYNGTDNFPAEKILKLSDAYLEKTDSPMLELKVRIININLPVNHPILERCRPLYEYSFFIQKIRDYIDSGKSRDEAIIQAMKDCEQEGIMAEFLREHGTEAVNMLFTEFNVEDALEVRFGEGQESMLKLVNAMIADGRSEEIARLQQDLEFRKEIDVYKRQAESRPLYLADPGIFRSGKWFKNVRYVSVSYTHLDVYKRQVLLPPPTVTVGPLSAF